MQRKDNLSRNRPRPKSPRPNSAFSPPPPCARAAPRGARVGVALGREPEQVLEQQRVARHALHGHDEQALQRLPARLARALLEESRRSLPSKGIAPPGIAPVGIAPPGVATPGAARSLAPPSSLERRVIVRLDELAAKGKLLGAQVCLRLGGRAVVDVCAGRKGVVDARAVSNADLFQVFEAGNVLVATLVLEQER